MASSNNSINPPSRTDTPNPQNPRFKAQNSTTEDLLQSQTVGLVHLSDFRKRRAEALEAKEREAFTPGSRSGAATPSDGASTPQLQPKKKKKNNPAKGKLSFALDDENGEDAAVSVSSTPRSATPDVKEDGDGARKKMKANENVAVAPKVMTKTALLKEAQMREQLRKEFLSMQEVVKATEFLLPFVFYDGTNIPGGVCKVKKGDHVWLFLDLSRKVGAELGVGSGEKSNSRREWARVGVDDLMLVRGEVIIPHHYEFYYFIVNKTVGPNMTPLFNYSAQPPTRSATASPGPVDLSTYDPLSRPKKPSNVVTEADSNLEGYTEDPNLTKVVDRRWYEKNKHIFPASVWEQYDPERDYSKGGRRDAQGNAFFFS